MKATNQRMSRSQASRRARACGARLIYGGGAGTICKWQVGKRELLFVPDSAYATEGVLTVRDR